VKAFKAKKKEEWPMTDEKITGGVA